MGGFISDGSGGLIRFQTGSGSLIRLYSYEKVRRQIVAKTSPGEFFRQVEVERKKIAWPSNRETLMTTVMVIIMTTVLGLFFFSVDSIFGWIVKMLLSLAAG
jgi:preprotein translocase subunit SecE